VNKGLSDIYFSVTVQSFRTMHKCEMAKSLLNLKQVYIDIHIILI